MTEIVTLWAQGIVRLLVAGSVAGLVLTVIAWGVIKLVRVRAPVYRHLVWLYCLVGAVVVPIAWVGGPKLTLAVLPARLDVDAVVTESDGSVGALEEWTAEEFIADSSGTLMFDDAGEGSLASRPNGDRLVVSWQMVLAGVWVGGVAVMLLRLGLAWWRARGIIRAARPVSEDEWLGETAGGDLRILVSSKLDSPVCFGL